MGRDEKPTIGKFTGKVNKEKPDRDWKDTKQRGKIKAPLAPASSAPKAGDKKQAEKQVDNIDKEKLKKYIKPKQNITKQNDKPKSPPSKGR